MQQSWEEIVKKNNTNGWRLNSTFELIRSIFLDWFTYWIKYALSDVSTITMTHVPITSCCHSLSRLFLPNVLSFSFCFLWTHCEHRFTNMPSNYISHISDIASKNGWRAESITMIFYQSQNENSLNFSLLVLLFPLHLLPIFFPTCFILFSFFFLQLLIRPRGVSLNI